MTTNPLFNFGLKALHASQNFTWEEFVDVLTHAPQYYSIWWQNLLHDSPQHVLIETSLILFIIWLIFIRRTVDPKKTAPPEKLSPKEVNWLIDTWNPDPLAPPISEKEAAIADNQIIIERVKPDHSLVVRGVNQPVINGASFDFLSIGRDPSIKEATTKALDHYGVGSCGPRGFYGTIDQHLILEQAVADFMGSHEAICYSDGASTVASAIPAFSKKGDLLLVDEACAEPIMSGANLSRSTVRTFRHNDMADLRRIMTAIAEEDVKLKRDASQQRRFIIVEGIYRNTGDICPLNEILALRKEFCYRIILDEAMSFGVLGANGRGITEHFNIPPMEVDVVTFTLDTVLSSVGGICVGSHEIVDHQRLSGAGYCFSASSSPFLCASAIQALRVMQQEFRPLRERLQYNIQRLRAEIAKIPALSIVSKDETPLIHLTVNRDYLNDLVGDSSGPNATPINTRRRKSSPAIVPVVLEEDWKILTLLARECVNRGLAVATNKFAILKDGDLPVTLMLTVQAGYDDNDLNKIVKALTASVKAVVK